MILFLTTYCVEEKISQKPTEIKKKVKEVKKVEIKAPLPKQKPLNIPIRKENIEVAKKENITICDDVVKKIIPEPSVKKVVKASEKKLVEKLNLKKMTLKNLKIKS